jgi:hypothetical protein
MTDYNENGSNSVPEDRVSYRETTLDYLTGGIKYGSSRKSDTSAYFTLGKSGSDICNGNHVEGVFSNE